MTTPIFYVTVKCCWRKESHDIRVMPTLTCDKMGSLVNPKGPNFCLLQGGVYYGERSLSPFFLQY